MVVYSCVGVTGKGFIAKGITFQNTAGAIAHQAVALRVSGDQSAFWQCSFDGFQDTLYTHALRQFYFGCTIYGTVDFVFGNAAAVLQNCTLLARPNLQGQENVYTAQGRTDPGQNTGFVLADCIIGGTPDLLPQSQLFPTFLGRPWKLYSLTVYINSTISGIVNPSGWLPWSGETSLFSVFFNHVFDDDNCCFQIDVKYICCGMERCISLMHCNIWSVDLFLYEGLAFT
jgi:pectinesterase